MLKALELFGFKSFADKTRLEFPSGVCVVVGPNGSGKSNIVDAVKWVLGSQSAKSLRGKEMIDVIFNGCASRAPAATGEVTLTLDNSEGRLAIESKEVHVTRRVYRSGEGEYLLNRQPCRLRDIRELLAGTGITTEAYCIIEQGKVDSLLQSSPRERRVIFEEAAGISQFKIKKATAMRRMERVEQNLLRLSDIVDEVESRLRSIRLQAGKARRYRECTERLRQLRTEVALVDWRTLTKQLTARDTQLAELQQRTDERKGLLEHDEAAGIEFERNIEASAQQLRDLEVEASATRELFAARQATVDNQHARRLELEQDIARIGEQLAGMSDQGGTTDVRFRDAAMQLSMAEADLAAAEAEYIQLLERADEIERELNELVASQQPLRGRLADCTRAVSFLADQISSLESQLPLATESLERAQLRLAELARQRDELSAVVASAEKAEADVAAETEQHHTLLSGAERRQMEARREFTRADAHHRRVDAQLTRVRERISVLAELEDRLEGLGTGVQDVLRMAADAPGELSQQVHGVIADLFHVDVDSASLIEVALGERTQFVVLTSAKLLLEWIVAQPLRVADRVGFLTLDIPHVATALDHVDLSSEPGVMGRADQFVETAGQFQSLARRLLGRTWLVDRLSNALRLSQATGRGLEFVTSDGELLAADGTLIVGPRHAAAGVLSRRSELRACQDKARDLERQLTDQAAVLARLDKERTEQEALFAATVSAYTAAAGKLADARRQTASGAAKLDRIDHEFRRLDEEHRAAKERIAATQIQIETNQQEQAKNQLEAQRLEAELHVGKQQLSVLQNRRAQESAAAIERKVVLARREQRTEMLRDQMQQAQRTQQEREQMLADARKQLGIRQTQLAELDDSMFGSRQILAELLMTRQRHAGEFAQHAAADEVLRRERAAIIEQIRSRREQLGALQAQQHKVEVTATRLRHERQTLCERMQDDYGIDFEQEAGSYPEGAQQGAGKEDSLPAIDREAVEREISQLRDQINNIGSINLAALDELEQIESRFEKLSTQYRDLVEAKASLERIIQRINTDSRQLFLTTLETIRGHFQELFRRLFGGGEADIIVDEAEDVLESGIEIVAKPPGKEACSISLLSGGEKTLTCVALLLAVFRSKPSPFCVLDEVDAALDEANIGRFVAVLREFLSFTQFIVITHSKKTMSGADTLYGVTMEESGVSKRVSVRFEDVSEDGHISPAAIRASNATVDGDANSTISRRAA
jgi:chromosome segregation protein